MNVIGQVYHQAQNQEHQSFIPSNRGKRRQRDQYESCTQINITREMKTTVTV